MTLMDEDGCFEEELSDAQKKYYSNLKKDYDVAMIEVNKLKKEATSIANNGISCYVKSTYNLRVQNSSTTPVVQQKQISGINVLALPTEASKVQTVKPSVSVIGNNQLMKTIVSAGSLKLPTIIQTQMSYTKPIASSVEQTNPAVASKKPVANVPPSKVGVSNAPQAKLPVAASSTVQQAQHQQIQQVQQQSASTAQPPKKMSLSTDELKNMSKTIPSLNVVVKPAKAVPEHVNQKKREALDAYVKTKLILNPREFSEWLMQARLVRSEQFGVCPHHSSNGRAPLQLGMYQEESKFPHSGGYVWISKCCDKNFVPIFRESLFENSPHPPAVLIKLIYHWACQTAVNNVVSWVKIDRLYLRTFYAMLRSVCTVQVHSNTPVFSASKSSRVEIGVISLGTTSADGTRRDVKVEVLGVYDQETQKLRLRACEPVAGDARSRSRFAKILEPLPRWVSTKAVILTDFTVDRQTLQELGYHQVVQKTLSSVPADDKLSNRTIMDYLRRTVPKVFQNTLSLLSPDYIQQFLDELVWRESSGLSSADAFHNILKDVATQSQIDTGSPLINRLANVTVDPFKNWSLDPYANTSAAVAKIPASTAAKIPAAPTAAKIPAAPTAAKIPAAPTAAVKRANTSKDGGNNAKEMKTSSYYATLPSSKQPSRSDLMTANVICQHMGCKTIMKSNIEIMAHMRHHLSNDLSPSANIGLMEQCKYCMQTFPSIVQKKSHEETAHMAISSFRAGNREDSATIADEICLICMERFSSHRLLEQHLDRVHVPCEMPYSCRICKAQTSAHSQLVDHFHSTHNNIHYLLCPICLETFPTAADNHTKGAANPGHLQYLAHLKSHVAGAQAARNHCNACTLSFLRADQLQQHVRADHTSMMSMMATRPFTFSVVKTPSVKPILCPSTSSATLHQRTYAVTTNPAVASTSSSSAPPSVAALPALSPSKARTSAKTIKKEDHKEVVVFDCDSSMISRRYPSLTVGEEVAAQKCVECGDELKKKHHFPGYCCCPHCRFSTNCAAGMKKHQLLVHEKKGQATKTASKLGSVFTLSQVVRCKCGFSSKSGLEVGRHFAKCRFGYVIAK